MDLSNKVAVVTGAGQGIGKEIALTLARLGANVVVSDINEKNSESVATEIGIDKAVSVTCDVSNKQQVDALINTTISKFGKLDILVNNAGIFPFKQFTAMTEEDWDKVLDVNLKSVFLCSQAAIKNMQKGGKIVTVSSIASFVGFEGLTHYCASKGGINAFTRALALEAAKLGINVNAVAPGAIKTPGAMGSSNEEILKQTIAAIPAGRMGEPVDIANSVAFLASDLANYITGQVLVVDGGYTLR